MKKGLVDEVMVAVGDRACKAIRCAGGRARGRAGGQGGNAIGEGEGVGACPWPAGQGLLLGELAGSGKSSIWLGQGASPLTCAGA